MAKGDYITVTYRTPVGVHVATITASQNGRKVELESKNDLRLPWIEAREITRGGTLVRSISFAAGDVLAIEVFKREEA